MKKLGKPGLSCRKLMVAALMMASMGSSELACGMDGSDKPNRRGFIKCSLALMGGAVATTSVGATLDYVAPEGIPLPSSFIVGDKKPKSSRYARTALESNLLLLGEIISKNILPSYANIQIGGTGSRNSEGVRSYQNMSTSQKLITDNLLVPINEELLFRLLPALAIGDNWVTGLMTGVAFAAGHNLQKDWTLDFSKIPVGHFLGGVYYWYLLRERGIDYSIFAHITRNVDVDVCRYLYKLFPDPGQNADAI